MPVSETFEADIKYSYHYGYEGGETIVQYDNHHGIHKRQTANGLVDRQQFRQQVDLHVGGVDHVAEAFCVIQMYHEV